ncbi:MAG: hypothetical protein JW840_00430 [Candidatus Thermoplasmatota archaeon]|nr:hypothetical protein [Candidatus Thermoplasmatota archaeon]
MGINTEYFQQRKEDIEKVTNQLQDTQQILTEMTRQHCIDTVILASLVAAVLLTFSYLLFTPLVTNFDITLYMFCLLIGPAAFFLLLLHIYELYGLLKQGEKSIPLTLDLMYFIYLAFSLVTMIGLNALYQQYHISQKFLTEGWGLGVFLLCGEVLLSLLCAKYVVTMCISKRLPHFFEPSVHLRQNQHVFHPRLFGSAHQKAKQVYYFRKKPDVSLWQNEEYFIRYK